MVSIKNILLLLTLLRTKEKSVIRTRKVKKKKKRNNYNGVLVNSESLDGNGVPNKGIP